MSQFNDIYYTSSTGVNRIRARICTPEGDPRAIVQIVHGIAEHVERYDDFMSFLASNGFVVIAEDHLGHGKSVNSPEETGFFAENDGWQRVLDDIDHARTYITGLYPGIPYVLFGHSMGSFLTRTYIIKNPDKYDAVIISGTGMQASAMVSSGCLMADAFTKLFGPKKIGTTLNNIAFGAYCKDLPSPETPFDWLSRDKEQVKKYIDDPMCGFVPTVSLFRDMMHGIKFISDKKNIALMNKEKPVYFMSGSMDPVGENGKGVNRAYKAFCDAGLHDVYLKLYPEGRHEMLNEINKDRVYDDILNWINSKI